MAEKLKNITILHKKPENCNLIVWDALLANEQGLMKWNKFL